MKIIMIIFGLCCFFNLSFALEITDIYYFGDSLTDSGNVYEKSGHTTPDSESYYEGRYSNGHVYSELLPDMLGVEYDPGKNFAHGGAKTGKGNVENSKNAKDAKDSADEPIGKYYGLSQQIQDVLSQNNNKLDNKALYIIWIGANDFLRLGPKSNVPAIVGTAIKNTVTAVATLAQAGAANIVVVNLPYLGNTPAAYKNGKAFQQKANQLTQQYNQLLAKSLQDAIAKLPEQVRKEIKLINVKVDNFIEKLQNNPADFFIDNVTESVLDNQGTDEDGYLYFDDTGHPSTSAHQMLAEYFKEQIESALAGSSTDNEKHNEHGEYDGNNEDED